MKILTFKGKKIKYTRTGDKIAIFQDYFDFFKQMWWLETNQRGNGDF